MSNVKTQINFMRINKTTIFPIFIICNFVFVSCANNEVANNEEISTKIESNLTTPLSIPDLSIPKGFVSIPKPKENSREILCAGSQRDYQWRVEAKGEKVKISKYDEYDIDEQIRKLPPDLQKIILQTRDIGNGTAYFHIELYENGWLAGLDAGEWGGRLTWFSSDGSQKIVILHDNIQGIAKVGNEVLILRGLAHISSDEGKVSKLVKDESGNFAIQPLVDLKSVPKSFAVDSNNSILISLRDKIIRVKASGEMQTLKEKMPYNNLNVSTAVTDSGIIYLGLWRFVLRFVPTPNGLQEQWFVLEDCQKFLLENNDCICQGRK